MLHQGVFIARYSRTVPSLAGRWFTAHWVIQFLFSGPLIFAGFALAYKHIRDEGSFHFRDSHTNVGLALLILYLIQLVWGAIIHFFKPTPKTDLHGVVGSIKARPLQNYGHALNGLTIIGLALYNVHKGYTYEWEYTFGVPWRQQAFTRHVNAWWIALLVVRTPAYGLWFDADALSRSSRRFIYLG